MFIYIIVSLFLGWLIVLTFYVYKIRNHYFKLIDGTKKHKIDEILDTLVEHDGLANKEIVDLKKQIDIIIKKSSVYFSRVGLVHFNPFGKTEGDKSFVLSLLDGTNSGVILNFIYTHEGIRIYVKRVKQGKGEEYELSDEEKRSVDKAV